MIGQPN